MESGEEKHLQEALYQRIILFFREELERKYQIEHLREIPSISEEGLLEGIDQENIDRVKNFFGEVLYPVGEERHKRDKSVEKVMAILNNSARLMMLLPKLPGIVFRHGGALVTASRAGSAVLSAYRFSSKIEWEAAVRLKEICEEEGVQVDDSPSIPPALYRRAFSRVPREWSEKMMGHVLELSKLGMHRGTIDATKDVLSAIRKTLSSEEERQAVDHALWVLDRLETEVRAHSREMMERLLKIAQCTEDNYIEELYGEPEE